VGEAVVSGKRAIPLFAQAFTKEVPRRSQNSRENTFARVLVDAVRRARATALRPGIQPPILISAHIIGRLLETPTLRRIGKRCPGGK
jgi:hypothetical protein